MDYVQVLLFILVLAACCYVLIGIELTEEKVTAPFLLICKIERVEIIGIISTSLGDDYLVRTNSGEEILCIDVTECKGKEGDTTWLLRTKWYNTVMDELPKWRKVT